MCSVNVVPRNIAKFTGKHLRQRLFINKDAGLRPAKKGLWHRCFPVNFAKFLRIPFLQNTSGGCFWRYHRLISYIYLDIIDCRDKSFLMTNVTFCPCRTFALTNCIIPGIIFLTSQFPGHFLANNKILISTRKNAVW